jgi:cytosine/creatinine deaminase
MRACFDAVTQHPAQIMGLEGYGIAPGCHADFVLLQARNPAEAIRTRAARLKVFKRGKLIAQTPMHTAQLSLPSRPVSVDWLQRGSAFL